MKKPLLYFLLVLISLSFISKKDRVKAIPGAGIIINNDSVLINKTTSEQLTTLLNLKDTFFIGFRISDGVNTKTGKSVYSTAFIKNVTYKGIIFEFSGKSKDSLKLKWIRIRNNPLLDVTVNDLLRLGEINPRIDKYFKKLNKYDHVAKDRLTYNLYSQGVSFQLDKILFSRRLTEISIHYKIEEK